MSAGPLRERLQAALGSAYTLDRELTGGGMAHVFVATETALHRRVVVKVLSPQLAEGSSAERFAREIELAVNLQDLAAHVAMIVGDREQAIAWLAESRRRKYYASPAWIRLHPGFKPLHGDPKFEKALH